MDTVPSGNLAGPYLISRGGPGVSTHVVSNSYLTSSFPELTGSRVHSCFSSGALIISDLCLLSSGFSYNARPGAGSRHCPRWGQSSLVGKDRPFLYVHQGTHGHFPSTMESNRRARSRVCPRHPFLHQRPWEEAKCWGVAKKCLPSAWVETALGG